MKKFLALLLTFLMIFLVSCGKKDGEALETGFKDPNTGIEYYYATPMGLYPVTPDEEYIKVQDGSIEMTYYKVKFEESDKFLCYEDSGNFFLVYSSEIEEPTVSSFKPIAASIYGPNNETYITSFYADNQYLPDELKEHNSTEDSWLCELIAEHITEGEGVNIGVTAETITDHYYIRLLSQEYPGLYYLVSFFGYNGRYYLRDGAAGKTVFCPNDVIVRMVGE